MPDIVLKKGAGEVKVKLEVLAGDQASSSCALWLPDPVHPDHYKKERDVKKSSDPEAVYYKAGDDTNLDGRVIEWIWTAVPSSGHTSGTVRLHVEQAGAAVAGYPLDQSFDFDQGNPVTYSFSRHTRVAP
jgi:hypothetical protein